MQNTRTRLAQREEIKDFESSEGRGKKRVGERCFSNNTCSSLQANSTRSFLSTNTLLSFFLDSKVSFLSSLYPFLCFLFLASPLHLFSFSLQILPPFPPSFFFSSCLFFSTFFSLFLLFDIFGVERVTRNSKGAFQNCT